ncbi:hypothetical protein ACFLU0_01055 [Chloroflexota bacterium]
MRSKKALYIILIVALAVFIISWAIGRPVWQALIFSIGFLLIVAVVSRSSLLIPERLLAMRFPRRFQVGEPSGGTGKTDEAAFLERMDSALAEFSAQAGATTEDIHRMTEYTRVMKGVGELVYEVHESVKSKVKEKQSRAFRVAVKELPRLISQFKDIPELTLLKDKKTMKRQAQGLDLYLLACSDFAEALGKSDGELAGRAATQISKALDLLDILGEPLTTTRRWW